MPIAKVQLSDGRIAKFEVPEGTSEDEIIAAAEHLEQPKAAPKKERTWGEYGQGVADQFTQGVTGNYSDELFNQIWKLKGIPEDKRAQMLAAYRNKLATQQEDMWGTSIAANVAGGLSTTALGGMGLAALAPKLASGAGAAVAAHPYLAAAGAGATQGAIYGAGSGTEEAGDRASRAVVGGGIGGVAGPVVTSVARNVVPPLAKGAVNLYRYLTGGKVDDAIAPVTPTVTQPQTRVTPTMTQQTPTVVLPTSQLSELAKQEGDIFPKTLGQRTQNPAAQRLEIEAAGGEYGKEAESAVNKAIMEQNSAYKGFVAKLGNINDDRNVNDIVDSISNAVQKNEKIAKNSVNSAYDLARQGKEVKINKDDIMAGLWSKVGEIRKEGSYDLPLLPESKRIVQRLGQLTKDVKGSRITAVKLAELEKIRSQATQARMASTDPRDKSFLNKFVKSYDDFMSDTANNAVVEGDANAINAFKNAVSERARYGKMFEQDQLVADIVAGKSSDDLARDLFGTGVVSGRKGMAESLDSILNAAGPEKAAVKSDMQAAVAKLMAEKSFSRYAPNDPATELLSEAKLNRFLKNLLTKPEFVKNLWGHEAIPTIRKATQELDLITSRQADVLNPSGSGGRVIRALQKSGLIKIPYIGDAMNAVSDYRANAQATKAVYSNLSEFMGNVDALKPKSTFLGRAANVTGGGQTSNAIMPKPFVTDANGNGYYYNKKEKTDE